MSTICAISTAKGGAIGIVRVSGPDAFTITDSIFEGKRKVSKAKGYSVLYGQIVEKSPHPLGTNGSLPKKEHLSPTTSLSLTGCLPEQEHTVVDDVLITVFRAPHSYTGEDSVEISCHGSAYILNKVVSLLMANGCEMAKPGEYTQRAFLNGKMDLSQAEAVADLIASTTKASHQVAMSQMRGGISRKLSDLRDQLLKMTSLLELELDFSEEDVEFADRQQLLELAQSIEKEIRRLSDSFSTGNAIKNGIPVAIIGAPNVGKSTLLNALLKDDRAIVSDIQGTTRDIIEDTINLGGYLFRFIDTAGIRHTADTIEKMGIERSIEASKKAQIIILLTEPGVPFIDLDLDPDQKVIKITNKSEDFQAINGKGLEDLEKQLIESVQVPQEDEVLITNLRHKQALSKAEQDIQRSIDSLEQQLSGDLVSEDLRLCIHYLADIICGEIPNTSVLQPIISRFCIGK